MSENKNEFLPPVKSKNVFTDIYYFLLRKPLVQTYIAFKSKSEREFYTYRILQRLNVSMADYYILNLHCIGVDVPVSIIFEELMNWNGDASCWPNKLAQVEWVNNNIETIKIDLFGIKKIPIFRMNAIRIQKTPKDTEPDNARYLLYECKGGYPIGVFSMYVRTSIPDEFEVENSQLFLMVGFNFFGSRTLSGIPGIRKLWEFIHNRATANILNRFKELCEWRFIRLQSGQL